MFARLLPSAGTCYVWICARLLAGSNSSISTPGTAKETSSATSSQQPLPTLVVSVHGEHSQPQPTQFQLKQQLACTKTKKGVGKREKKKKKKERGSFSFSISFPSCGTTDEPVLINPSLSAAGRHRAASLVCQHRCSPRARNKPNQGNGPWQPGTTSGQQQAAQGGPLTQTSNLTEIIFSADPHEA